MSFVFYDTETTGTNSFFDQILQIAAMRTDANLNELERINLRCRILPHIVPSPGAMNVTKVRPHQLTDASLASHYEMMRSVRAKFLSWSPAVFLGYNSVRFDEILFRQALYQTLHAPYLTNTNGNTRSDVMRIVQATRLFAPNALSVPLDDEGMEIFKLEKLAPANGFDHINAHDAMADVEATIHLCRLVADRVPEVWSTFMRFSKKVSVTDYITSERVFCLSESYFGAPYAWLVTALGPNPANGSEWYVYDLNIHPDSLRGLDDNELLARLDRSPKPIKRLRVNAAPTLFAAEDAPEICKAKALSFGELEARASLVLDDDSLRTRMIAAFESLKSPYPPSPHVEKQIYDAFISNEDQALLDEFHVVPWEQRHALIARLTDRRLQTIGRRLIYFERPDLLEAAARSAYAKAAARRILSPSDRAEWLTLSAAIIEVDNLLSAEGCDETLLQQHRRHFLEQIEIANGVINAA